MTLGGFIPGKLEARAYIKGKVVARHAVETAGEPARVEVALDDMGVRPEARDLVFARARLVDASGRQVFASGVPVTFAASGGYEIVGPATATTEAGVASVLVRTVRPGAGKVTARRD